jgi:hypothetical protein
MIPMATINQYASQIAGTPVVVVCDSPPQWGGYVVFDGKIHLQPGLCAWIRSVDKWNGLGPGSAEAMLSLQHEAEHYALNTGDEALVECTTVQNRWNLVRLFKLPARIASWIMDQEVAYHHTLPAPYQNDC